MAIIPRGYFDATVAIGVKTSSNAFAWCASGFFVGRPENEKLCSVYLITNRHVVENLDRIWIQVNSNSGIKQYDCLLRKGNERYYSIHPTDDVVAIRVDINNAVNEGAEMNYFNLDSNALSLVQMKSTGIAEGCLIYTLGFPVGVSGSDRFIVDNMYKSPLVRIGCISKIENTYHSRSNKAYLIDSTVFPGNSGGPVINRPEFTSLTNTLSNTSTSLIGIVSAYLPYQETLRSCQTGRNRTITEENSGLTIVYPVDSIKVVVELERQRTIAIQNDKPAST